MFSIAAAVTRRSAPVAVVSAATFCGMRALSTARVLLDAGPSDGKAPELKKFWRAVTLAEEKDGWQVLLDGRKVRTPKGTPLVVARDQTMLAHLVSAEWEAQEKLLRAYSLPLTSIIVRSLDDLNDAEVRRETIDKLMKFLQTDATCYLQEHPQVLVDLQETHWVPLVDWARKRFGVELRTTTSLLAPAQPAATTATLRAHVETYSPLQLSAFERAVLTSKSFVIGLALVEGAVSAEEATAAASVEVQAQIDVYGEVEDAHDVDREDLQRTLASTALVVAKI
ncbi:hypothetical protein BC828DRAFT_388234 [Blastocladiella britannica]|nr:hypothetical protein BC828DRAFT_388234 [Blastocladiella britannica]